MTFFLELKDKLKVFYGKYDTYLLAALKFITCFLFLYILYGETTNVRIGSTMILVFLGASALCAIFPQSLITVFSGALLLYQAWNTSLEYFVVMAMMLAIMMFIFLTVRPGNSVVMVITVILTLWKVPGIIIVLAGMLMMPFVIVPLAFGVVIGSFLLFVSSNLTNISMSGGAMNSVQKIIFMTNGVIKNETVWLLVLAIVVTVCLVYVIRKAPFRYSWLAGGITSGIVFIVVVLAGGYMTDIRIDTIPTIAGSVIGVVLALLLYQFVYTLDYSRVEYVQFEDDDNVYYVKVVPRMMVTKAKVSVKTINERVPEEERKKEAEKELKAAEEQRKLAEMGDTSEFAPINVAVAGTEPEESEETEEKVIPEIIPEKKLPDEKNPDEMNSEEMNSEEMDSEEMTEEGLTEGEEELFGPDDEISEEVLKFDLSEKSAETKKQDSDETTLIFNNSKFDD